MLNFGKKKKEIPLALPAKVEEKPVHQEQKEESKFEEQIKYRTSMMPPPPPQPQKSEVIPLPESLSDCEIEHFPINQRYYPKFQGYYLMAKDDMYVACGQGGALWSHSAPQALDILVRAMEFFGRGTKQVPITEELYNEYLKVKKTWHRHR